MEKSRDCSLCITKRTGTEAWAPLMKRNQDEGGNPGKDEVLEAKSQMLPVSHCLLCAWMRAGGERMITLAFQGLAGTALKEMGGSWALQGSTPPRS